MWVNKVCILNESVSFNLVQDPNVNYLVVLLVRLTSGWTPKEAHNSLTA